MWLILIFSLILSGVHNTIENISTSSDNAQIRENIKYKQITINENKKEKEGRVNGATQGYDGYCCNKCDAIFIGKLELQSHITIVHKEVTYKCNQCEYKATSQDHLSYHTQLEHLGVNDDNNKTDYKTTGFKESGAEELLYECNKCEYKASLKGNSKKHREAIH